MLCYPDNIIYLILIKKFNGFSSLAKSIIDIKNDAFFIEFKKTQKEVIECNFYNWLNHDLLRREMLWKGPLENIDRHLYFHYVNNLKGLGLNKDYTRNKSLSKCFESKWWKLTEKSYGNWETIHRIIKSDIVILKATVPDCDFNNIHDWNEITRTKSKDIINKFYCDYVYEAAAEAARFLLEDIEFIYLDMDSLPIVIE